MISKKETPITTVVDWREFLNKNPQFERFTPTHFNGEIQSYDCSCLTLESMCSDYQTRPQMCIDYPRSYFNIHGKVHHGCGYYPEINYYWYQRLFKSIQMKMDLFFVSS